MAKTGIYKVIEDDGQYEDEASYPARVWRATEAECEAWIATVGRKHPFQVALGYVSAGPYAPTPLPYVVIDRAAPAGEDRVLERYAVEAEAREYIDVMERFSLLDAYRPHYGLVHEDRLEAALEAPSTRLLPGDAVRMGTAKDRKAPWYPELSNFESSTMVRTVETPLGTVHARLYPTGQLRVTAGQKAKGSQEALPPLVLPSPEGPRGSVAFDAVFDLRGNEATLAGLRRTVHDRRDQPTENKDLVSLADRQAFGAARYAAQAMAANYPNERLEGLARYHARCETNVGNRIDELRRQLREAESSLKLHREAKEEAAQALDLAETQEPTPRMG